MSDNLGVLRKNIQNLDKEASQYWLVKSLIKRLNLARTSPVGLETFKEIWECLFVQIGVERLLMLKCSSRCAWPESTKVLSEAIWTHEDYLSSDDSLPKFGPGDLCLFLVDVNCELPKWERSAISKILKTMPVLIVVEDANTRGREFGGVFDYCEMYIAEEAKGKPVLVTDGDRMSLLMKAFQLTGPRLLKSIGWGPSKCVCEALAKMLTGYVAEVTLLEILTSPNAQARCTFAWLQRLLVSLFLVFTIPFFEMKFDHRRRKFFVWIQTYAESDDIRDVLHQLAKQFWKSVHTLPQNYVVTRGRDFIKEVGKSISNCFTKSPDTVNICEHIQQPEFNQKLCKELQILLKV